MQAFHKYWIIIFFITWTHIVYSQLEKCNFIKKGEFTIIDPIVGNSRIKRRRHVQIEYGEESRLKLKLKIIWIDDCTYSLTLLKVLENPKKIPVPKTLKLIVEIIEFNENYFRMRITNEVTNVTLIKLAYKNKL